MLSLSRVLALLALVLACAPHFVFVAFFGDPNEEHLKVLESLPSPPEHLIVVQHGFAGLPASVGHLAATIRAANPGIAVYVSGVNSGLLTTDGIEEGGLRVADEVRTVLESRLKGVTRVSFVGLSLGGMYSRVAAADLLSRGPSDGRTLAMDTFVTLATPHCGAGHSMSAVVRFVSRYIGKTAYELGCHDNCTEVARLAGKHAPALAQFRRRVAFANTVNDHRVDYLSAAVWPVPHPNEHGRAVEPGQHLREIEGEWAELYGDMPPFPGDSLLLPAQREAMVTLRKSGGPWTNVDVLFNSAGATFLAHNHIAASFRGLPFLSDYLHVPGQQSVEKVASLFRDY